MTYKELLVKYGGVFALNKAYFTQTMEPSDWNDFEESAMCAYLMRGLLVEGSLLSRSDERRDVSDIFPVRLCYHDIPEPVQHPANPS